MFVFALCGNAAVSSSMALGTAMLVTRLKYLNKYWIDPYDILYKHSYFPDEFTY